MFSKLKKELKSVSKIDITDEEVPLDPQEFYEKLGFLQHPKTGNPVEKLTDYQYEIWKVGFTRKYRLIIKSQKVGLSTSALMEDLQRAILPSSDPNSCRGKEILIVAQSIQHARQHIYTMRKMIKNSKTYSKFLITSQNGTLFKDETTKATTVFLHNPDNPNKPTRIIGLGPDERGLWSWKNVKHIHMSDIAINDSVDDSGAFNAAFSRLANTQGSIHIETPPKGMLKTTWKIYQASKLQKRTKDSVSQFWINEISYHEAIKAGIMTEEFIAGERERLGPEFGVYYECQFQNPSTTWYDKDLFRFSDDLADKVNKWNEDM